MIQVIQRAFDIIGLLAEVPERPLDLGTVASKVGLHPATTARILKSLVDVGYVEQLGRRKGYVLGPVPYALAANGTYRKDLAQAAEPVLITLAREIDENVMLVAMRHAKRTIVCCVDAHPVLQVNPNVRQVYDPYISATGRLLLAHIAVTELESFLRLQGMPHERWPEVRAKEDLVGKLAEIRTQGQVLLSVGGETTGAATTVERHGEVIAAVGVHLATIRFSDKRKVEILAAMRSAGAAIAVALENSGAVKYTVGTRE